jgi:FKBP-type peptidyl-prolyl cis-trans isomerase (trigger factor)
MKTAVKKLESGKHEISVEIGGEIVKNKFEEVFKAIAKEAKVPGFRPGNAPRDILEKNFSAAAHEQVLKELIPDLYNQAIEKEKIDAIDLPEISEVKLDRSSISFKATVEVHPEIKLKEYKKIKVATKKIEVTPDEIKRTLDSFKEMRKLETIDDTLAKSVGYPNLAELEKSLERQLLIQKENAERTKRENQIVEAITKDMDFRVPESLVARQLEEMLKQAKVDLALKGVPREKIAEREKEMVKELEQQARSQVKIYLILSEIAKKENIAQDDHMPRNVIEFLLKEADWQETA